MINTKEKVIFDTWEYYDEDYRNDLIAELIEDEGDLRGWYDADDIPSEQIESILCSLRDEDWMVVIDEFDRFTKDNTLICTGTVQRWDGYYDGGTMIKNSYDLRELLSEYPHIKIYDEGGHLMIVASHHDGTDRFELKVLTKAGEKYYENHYGDIVYDDKKREVFTKLFDDSHYSKLPHFWERIFG